MAEYIEREAALEIIKRTSGDYASAFEELRKLPAADVAPTIDVERPTKAQFKRMTVQLGYEQVVHCKDCKYGFFSTGGNLYCAHSEGLSSQTPDAFCSYGEYKRNTEGTK